MFQRLIRGGSFRTYTVILCAFYLLLVFMFHSSLQPGRPRGISAHAGEQDEELIGEKGINDVLGSENEERAQQIREEEYAKQRERDLHVIKNDVKEQIKEQVLKPAPVLKDKVDQAKPAGEVQMQQDKTLGSYHNLVSAPAGCSGKDLIEKPDFVQVAGDIFVYSVYWDERANDFDNLSRGSYLRLISVVKTRVAHMRRAVFCIFHDDQGSVVPVQATYYEMCENHNRLFGGYILSCAVPPSITKQPCSVVVSGSSDPLNGHTFKVQSTVVRENRRDFSVCVSPLFGRLNPVRTIEWLELTAGLGAQHITFYHYNISEAHPVLKSVLQHYVSRGLVTVMAWPLRLTQDSAIWYHGQLVAVQDCLYRNMGSTRYLAFNDLDEYLVPHTHSGWSDLMTAVDKDNIAGFQSHSAFFDPSRQEKAYTGKQQHLLTLTDTYRSVSTSRVRTKCMLKPQRVFEVGIHHISKPILAHLRIERLDLPVAVLHHYRKCMPNYGMNCHSFEQDTVVTDKHGDLLANNVAKVLKTLKAHILDDVDDEALRQILNDL